ncbi:MAG: phosphoribosylamine--glycine ligase, partial [Clostridia bacterium]|nr:phosphoribosylamine--glycine ligase [Clostridia bacterium]
TSGGRVLGVVARGKDLREALALAYGRVEQVSFTNEFYRRDIGKRALEA